MKSVKCENVRSYSPRRLSVFIDELRCVDATADNIAAAKDDLCIT